MARTEHHRITRRVVDGGDARRRVRTRVQQSSGNSRRSVRIRRHVDGGSRDAIYTALKQFLDKVSLDGILQRRLRHVTVRGSGRADRRKTPGGCARRDLAWRRGGLRARARRRRRTIDAGVCTKTLPQSRRPKANSQSRIPLWITCGNRGLTYGVNRQFNGSGLRFGTHVQFGREESSRRSGHVWPLGGQKPQRGSRKGRVFQTNGQKPLWRALMDGRRSGTGPAGGGRVSRALTWGRRFFFFSLFFFFFFPFFETRWNVMGLAPLQRCRRSEDHLALIRGQ